MRSPELASIAALATDYDRTLTDIETLQPVPRAIAALAKAREAGGRVVIVSGRPLDFLLADVGHVADAVVAENGSFLWLPGGEARRLGPEIDLRKAFAHLSFPIEYMVAMASADVEHEPTLRAALDRAGISAALIRNRDRVMVLPAGVDKALGVLAALSALGIPATRAAAAGDGENDIVMLAAVAYGISVANGVDDLKGVARHVTSRDGGEGLADWVESHWLPMLGVKA